MTHFLRGKQAGIQNDFSAGLASDLFMIDDIARYGINSQINALAYDPIQSLLAVGTKETQYGSGQICVFGHKRVEVRFELPRKASVQTLAFCSEKLICSDSKNQITVYDLEAEKILSKHLPPGTITATTTDPSLDWVFLGLQNGDVVVYDLDRASVAPLKIPCHWKERAPRSFNQPVLSIALHPRDIGSLLIGYSEGAVIYSFKQNKVTKTFELKGRQTAHLTQAVWHPTGTFILTVHSDGSFVTWDPKESKIVNRRNLQEPNLDRRGGLSSADEPNAPIAKITWCCKDNPDDTALLIAGGTPSSQPMKGLSFLELGPTPVYATSSWQVFSNHFENPKRQRLIPTPPQADVVDFVLIPRTSPYFAGAQDPVAIIVLLGSGELVTLSFPTGHLISPTNQLHQSLTFVHPFVVAIDYALVERGQWLSLLEDRMMGPLILKGGAEPSLRIKRTLDRNVVLTGHVDGTLRLWDTRHGNDQIEQEDCLQVDIARAVNRLEGVEISAMSLSSGSGELAVGLRTGEVCFYRWGRNPVKDGVEPPLQNYPGLQDIQHRSEPSLMQGLMPVALLERSSPVATLRTSDVGFIVAGFENGEIVVVDMRGPAVIFSMHISDLAKQNKRSSIGSMRRSGTSQSGARPEWATKIEFGVMNLEHDSYSSILFFVGTNHGHLATFKLFPQGNKFGVELAGTASLDDRIVAILPINAESGHSASATQAAVAGLRTGLQVNGVLLVVTETGARLFRPASAKGASKSWDQVLAYTANVTEVEGRFALVVIFGDNSARSFSIPGLKEIGASNLNQIFDPRKLSATRVMPSGEIFGWTGPSEIAQVNCWGAGRDLKKSQDKLYNVEMLPIPRPTISNMQWISGTQYMSPADLDLLIGGPGRAPSARQLEATRLEQQAQTRAGPSNQPEAEGWGEYMQRQLNERTEKLNIMGDSMDSVQKNSEGWTKDVNKFISQTKRKAVLGGLSSKFGL
ncbi:MAG: hypothetical protein M1814_004017 [Vezdaea aestivalis]|nr:MAG: hypothetical protein M1814_004017 [Vezdaea aestivalis]